MKKFNLFVIAPLVIGGIGTGVGVSHTLKSLNETSLGSAEISTFKTTIKNPFLLESDVTLTYEGITSGFKVKNQIASDYRMEEIYYNDEILLTQRIKRGSAGEAIEEGISVSNTVIERPLIDDKTSAPLSFDDLYANPFRKIGNLRTNQFEKYFTTTFVENTYVLSATDLGYGLLTKDITNFLKDFDSYGWDLQTLAYNIEDLKFTLSNDGTPLSVDFTKVKRDRYGAIQEFYHSTITPIAEVEHLQPFEAKMSDSDLEEYNSKMSAFQEKINKGNFTQSFSLMNGQVEYSNFYDYDYHQGDYLPSMMLSNLELYDASYGLTYVGMVQTYEGYAQYAISPEAGFSSTMNSNVYPTMAEVLPNFANISGNFFEKQGDYYIFDLSSFVMNDVEFSAGILESIFTQFDPCVAHLGLYLNDYSYDFTTLVFTFDANGNLIGALQYYYYGYLVASAFAITNVGTTNLYEEETLQVAIDCFLNTQG